MKPESGDWNRDLLEQALVALFHGNLGMRRAMRHPVVKANRQRIAGDAEAIDYLSAFTEHAMQQLGITKGANHDHYIPHIRLSAGGSTKPHVSELPRT